MSASQPSYLTKEASEELEKFDKRFRMRIIAGAMLIASEENTIVVHEGHVKKATEKVFVFKHGDISRAKWFSYITPIVLLGFVFFHISQITHSSQTSLWCLPIIVILWFMIYCYVFRDFLTK